MWWNNWMPWMFFGPAMMLIFLAVCVALGYLMMRAGAGRPGQGRALDILRERYARGEIDQREFEERRRLLQG